jgi:hypothetical protein
MSSAITRPRFWLYATLLATGTGVLGYQHFARLQQRALAACSVLSSSDSPEGQGHLEILSAAYMMDRLYQSMEGPAGNQPAIKLSPAAKDDAVLFITGVSSQVVDEGNRAGASAEFFCHANLTLNPETSSPDKHNASFEQPAHMDWRLATLVPGSMSLQLPAGFGVPVKNGTQLDYYTMALNQNPGTPHQSIRIKSRIDYTRAPATRPLFRRSVYVHQQFRDLPSAATVVASTEHAGAACGQTCNRNQLGSDPSLFVDLATPTHPGATCCVSNASDGGVMPQFGTGNTIHWMVPPGTHSFKTDVTAQMELPYDTTAHFITGHLHPCGKSMRLVDKQSGKVVFEITSQDFKDKIGVQHMSDIVSSKGVPMRKGHPLELVAEYENTTDHPMDAMAIMYLYLAESPDWELLAAKN